MLRVFRFPATTHKAVKGHHGLQAREIAKLKLPKDSDANATSSKLCLEVASEEWVSEIALRQGATAPEDLTDPPCSLAGLARHAMA